ncbi:uncharacterized protein LOC120085566 isoform X2 [Benincasa hispida]|uniref:uncharacterized protein LOC120085566 isoform X2 n=1 Tax=Benincasa hispida TaxID=102211 RepID=UPI0018FF7F5C|nr:uncharacterized protein LOC120085566 isoform X2 [Benincasa hispida]
MTDMAGFSVRASIQLQHRVLSISWVKKSGVFTCLKARVYSSSGPVRYIPKRSLNDKKSRTHSAPEIVNENDFSSGLDVNARRIEVKHRDAVRRSNVNDKLHDENQYEKENYSAGGSMLEPEAVDEELNIYDKKCYDGNNDLRGNKTKQDAEKCYDGNNDLRSNKSKQDAEKLAIELLATRAFTAVELRKKLLGKRISPDTVEVVINDFKSRGLINDGLYAEAFSRSRWSSFSWGPRKIKQALVNKGIGGEVAQKAIKLVFEDGEESSDGMSSVGLSKVSMDHLFVQASKQWMRVRDAPEETRKSRIIRWLQYRGFDWGVTRTILKKLETEYPP